MTSKPPYSSPSLVRIDAELLIPGRDPPLEKATCVFQSNAIVWVGSQASVPPDYKYLRKDIQGALKHFFRTHIYMVLISKSIIHASSGCMYDLGSGSSLTPSQHFSYNADRLVAASNPWAFREHGHILHNLELTWKEPKWSRNVMEPTELAALAYSSVIKSFNSPVTLYTSPVPLRSFKR